MKTSTVTVAIVVPTGATVRELTALASTKIQKIILQHQPRHREFCGLVLVLLVLVLLVLVLLVRLLLLLLGTFQLYLGYVGAASHHLLYSYPFASCTRSR